MQTFTPTDLKYTYSPHHEPIGTVGQDEVFTVITEDCFTGRFKDPADFSAESAAWVEENLDGVTGPIAVAPAEPGDAIAVTIEAVEVTTPGCVVVSRCRAHSPADWWHEEDHVVNLEITGDTIKLGEGWTVPVRPLIGCLATTPERETVLSRHQGAYGGNVDCTEITNGATVVLPVTAPGGGLYFGDCKAAMGDGEVVAAPEVGARIRARARGIERPAALGAPRVYSPDRLTTIVSGISLADACRSAFRELKLWIEDEWSLTSEQAAVVMGVGAHCGIGQVSNLLHTAKCSIARSLLPRRPDHGGEMEARRIPALPWHGVLVANPVALDAELAVDFDAYAEHIGWLAASGCDGITPNGSLGEYQTLTDDERERVVTKALAAAPDGFAVIPAVGAYGSGEAVRWAEQAAAAGAPAVMALPPNAYRADERSVFAHYRALAAVGLPVVAYNNPLDTKVDLVLELLARLHGEGLIVAVKEFAGDPRRAYAVRELAPDLDVLIGSDDTVLEVALAGAKGWISGYTSVFPRACIDLYRASVDGDLETALPLYRALHPLLRWDSQPEFVQAIKLSMDIVGRHGGGCRPPRVALAAAAEAEVRRLTERALAAGTV